MGRIGKILLWLIGLAVVLVLFLVPAEQVEKVWRVVPMPLAGKVIVLDPGHGGPDGGAVGRDKTNEKVITLEVAEKVRDYLEQAGAVVYLTREVDTDLAGDETQGLSERKSIDIRNRLQIIHDKEADLFISIHLNALPSSQWSGAQTFYDGNEPENKHLAEMIQAEIIRNLANTERVPLEIRHMYLLKHAEVPGALVELGFLSNDRELKLLKQNDYQDKMAASMYQGILRYSTEEMSNEE